MKEVQQLKSRNLVLESDVRALDEQLQGERGKFAEELAAISTEINKLRNIQHLYLKEKTMSEQMEYEFNRVQERDKENVQLFM